MTPYRKNLIELFFGVAFFCIGAISTSEAIDRLATNWRVDYVIGVLLGIWLILWSGHLIATRWAKV